MSASPRIWKGGPSDAALLATLHAASFADAWPEPAFTSLLERDEVMAFIGALAEEPAGFVLVRAVADEAEVLTFCVAQEARRNGLGRGLLDAVFAAARERGVAHVFLEVGARNDPAICLYRGVGFSEVGRRTAYYQHGTGASDALVMRRAIN